MYSATTLLVIAGAATWGLSAQQARTNPPRSPASGSEAREITLKTVEPARVIYQEHEGAYWTIGPVFARVQEYMFQQGQTGPMFIRYLDSPSTVSANKPRAEVGFFSSAGLQAKPPYRAKFRASETVAAMVVKGPVSGPRRYHTRLRRWAAARGHVPTGNVTEIFRPADGPGGAESRVEVRMAIRPMTNRRAPAIESARNRSRPDPGPRAGGRVDRIAEAPREEVAPVPSDRPAPDATPVAASTSVDRPAFTASVAELIRQGEFDRVAEVLMPLDHPMPDTLKLWFGQVVFRIGAIAGGVKQVYPGQEATVSAMSTAIRSRYDVISANFTVDPRSEPVHRADPRSDVLAERKRGIMRELDTILGGLAVMQLDANAAEAKLFDIVQRVYQVIRDQAAGATPHAP